MNEKDRSKPRFPRRLHTPGVEEVDANGDAIFRFGINSADGSVITLTAFYRSSIRDLLKIVRLYSGGKPVLVDSFAFANRPDQQIRIFDPEAGDGTP